MNGPYADFGLGIAQKGWERLKRRTVGKIVRKHRAPTMNLPIRVFQTLRNRGQCLDAVIVEREERSHSVLAVGKFGDEFLAGLPPLPGVRRCSAGAGGPIEGMATF